MTKGTFAPDSKGIAHTFSIVARDRHTGEMGVAVQSHWFSTGTVVPWAQAGVGAVATQAMTNVSFGPRGLELMAKGMAADKVVEELVASDGCRDIRQFAVIDKNGKVAAWTGRCCIKEAGHIVGRDHSVQANLMQNDTVPAAMALAFERSDGPLAERMLLALEAGDAAGGDIRGKQSAALIVVRGQATGNIWEDRTVDLRVDDHPEPIAELRRLLRVHRAYELMNKGDEAMAAQDMAMALSHYAAAEDLLPDNEEIKFWHAVALVNNFRIKESLLIFKEVFAKDPRWRTIVERLIPAGLIQVEIGYLAQIMSQ